MVLTFKKKMIHRLPGSANNPSGLGHSNLTSEATELSPSVSSSFAL